MVRSINVDKIVTVTGSAVNPIIPQYKNLGNVVLTANNRVPFNVAKQFTNVNDVGTFFGTSSDEYKYAQKYFASYEGTLKLPSLITYWLFVTTALAPYVRSKTNNTALGTFKALPNTTTLKFTIDGTERTTGAIDLTGATSLTQVASIIQTALRAVSGVPATTTCTFDAVFKEFSISSAQTGATHTMDYCKDGSPSTNGLATLLGLTQSAQATLSQGSDALTTADNLTNLLVQTRNFINISYMPSVDVDANNYEILLDVCAWLTNNPNYYFLYYSTNDTILNNTDGGATVVTALVNAGYGEIVSVTSDDGISNQFQPNVGIYLNYSDYDLAGAIAGTGASIDYTAPNGTISFAYKTYTGIVPLVTTDEGYVNVLSNGFNFYGFWGTAAEQFNASFNGQFGGIYKWLDNFYNQIWFEDYIQVTLANLLRAVNKLPANAQGVGQIQGSVNAVLKVAGVNGVIQSGNIFDNAGENAVLIAQAGTTNVITQLQNAGVFVLYPPITSIVRTTRVYNGIKIWYTNGQSINRLSINTIFAS